MQNEISREVLLQAVKLIKFWHDFPNKKADPTAFQIYYDHAPEMKIIRDTLGVYDDIKNELQ